MTKIYLAIAGVQDVFFSKNKEDVEKYMAGETFIPHSNVVEVQIPYEHFVKIPEICSNAGSLKTYPKNIPEKYYAGEQKFVNNPPGWFKQTLALTFTKDGKCYHSSSLNNLNSFYEKAPNKYHFQPFDLHLSNEDYVNINAYVKFMCDNF